MKQHKNKKPGGKGLGNSGNCICDICGLEIPHQRGVKCMDLKCSNCGTTLNRKESTDRVVQSAFKSIISKALVLGELCIGCNICIETCPVAAITMDNLKAFVNEEKCIGCMKCVRVCPQEAIVRSSIS